LGENEARKRNQPQVFDYTTYRSGVMATSGNADGRHVCTMFAGFAVRKRVAGTTGLEPEQATGREW